MIILTLLYLCAIASCEKPPPYSLREGPQHFEEFIQTHNKVYSSEGEKAKRYEIFLRNLVEINDLNAKNNYTHYGINKFADLTSEEFKMKHTCTKSSREYVGMCSSARNKPLFSVETSTGFDWREKNMVTRVKDQGQCGSCWAFSTIGNVESVHAIASGQLLTLSEQQLVDCDHNNQGCSGGFMNKALRYLTSNGAMSANSYPYQGADGTCRYNPQDVAVKISSCVEVSGSEDQVAQQLTQIGPLAIGVDASSLQSYSGGVITKCMGMTINHGVLIVGYGVDSTSGLSYWIVKNSWGESWGESGYFRIQKGVNCLGFTNIPPVSAVIQ